MPSTPGLSATRTAIRSGKEQLRILGAAQHGVFSASQAGERGLDRHALQRWSRSGEIRPLGGRVWAIAGSPETEHRTAMVRLLEHGPDGAIGLRSAGAVWGMSGYRLLPVQVIRVRTGNRRPNGGRHTSTRFGDRHVTTRDGLRVTTPGRTLFDLAGREHPDRVANLVDRCLSRRLVTIGALQELLFDLQGRGRPGIRVMRELIEARLTDDYQPTDSNLESRFEAVLVGAGILGFERQVTVGDADGAIGRVDYLWRSPKLVVEIQSELYHRSLTDRQRDAERLRRLRAAGWVVLEIAEHDVWFNPEAVVAQVADALAAAWKAH